MHYVRNKIEQNKAEWNRIRQSRIEYEVKSANIRRERGEHKMFANRCYIMCSKRWREKNSKKGRLFFSSTFCCHSPITMC